MCGRYTLTCTPEVFAEEFRLEATPDHQPRYNVAPSQAVVCVRATLPARLREAVTMRWGLIPSWTRDPAKGMNLINARAETATEKPSFRKPFRERRCLVLADGYYEWKREGTRKQPYYIRLKNERPFAFAGLWDRWSDGMGITIESCAVLTTKPNERLASIHDRMPVILHPGAYEPWLDPGLQDATRLVTFLTPYPADAMIAHPVGALVNDPRVDDARCIEAMETPDHPSRGQV
ncbi:MAG: SOS response-associated peptidase [Nitrospira sp.]|nr:SOS response-associated peptidase [Nitrospira sp.]MCY4133289.1 SOS response-associated peptidase [Nitrospira sp.]